MAAPTLTERGLGGLQELADILQRAPDGKLSLFLGTAVTEHEIVGFGAGRRPDICDEFLVISLAGNVNVRQYTESPNMGWMPDKPTYHRPATAPEAIKLLKLLDPEEQLTMTEKLAPFILGRFNDFPNERGAIEDFVQEVYAPEVFASAS